MTGVFEEKKSGTISDEEIANLNKDALELQKDYNRRRADKFKEVLATKEKLFARKARTFDVKVPVGEDENGVQTMMVFKVRRLTHEERMSFDSIKPYDQINPDNLTDEDYKAMSDQGYEILEKVVTEPKLTTDEWRQLDIATTQDLITKISFLQYETNDNALTQTLLNLSEM
jgi:hypothetical protein